jgi:hypothetical protein
MDARFTRIDAQMADFRAEVHQLRDDVDAKLGDFRVEVRAEFDEVKGLIRLVDRRVGRLERRRR